MQKGLEEVVGLAERFDMGGAAALVRVDYAGEVTLRQHSWQRNRHGL